MDRKQTGKSNWDDQLSDVNDEGMQTYGLNGLSVTPQKMQVQKPPSAQAGTLQHDLEMLASENNYDNEKNPNRNTFYQNPSQAQSKKESELPKVHEPRRSEAKTVGPIDDSSAVMFTQNADFEESTDMKRISVIESEEKFKSKPHP